MTKSISIQVQNDDEEILKKFDHDPEIDFVKLETSSFDGQSEIVTLLVTLTPMVLTFLGKVITEQIKSKRYVRVIYKGVQIQGINEKNVATIIKEITDDEK